MQQPKLVLLDADSFVHNTEHALVVLEISREQVETISIASALERLLILTDSAQNVRLYRDSLVLMLDGYDKDPRELPEIPEVRLFFKRLVEEWPNFLWFLNRDMGSIELILSLLCQIDVSRSESAGFQMEIRNPDELKQVIGDMFSRGNILLQTYEITEDEAVSSAETALDMIYRKAF